MYLKEIFSKEKINEKLIMEARIITAKITGHDVCFLIANPDYNLNFLQNILLRYYLKKLKKNVPLAYILGCKEFFGLEFFVNKNVLIPRADTEIMIEAVIDLISADEDNKITLIDIGTGSGCIPISILKNTDKNTRTLAGDISKKALKIAKINAKKHKVNIEFFHGDLLQPFFKKIAIFEEPHSRIIITANLPYLTPSQHKSEPSIYYEPKQALISDNADGLLLYKKLFNQIKVNRLINKYFLTILIEIDPRQINKILEIIEQFFTDAKIQIKKDLAGLDRLIIIKLLPN